MEGEKVNEIILLEIAELESQIQKLIESNLVLQAELLSDPSFQEIIDENLQAIEVKKKRRQEYIDRLPEHFKEDIQEPDLTL